MVKKYLACILFLSIFVGVPFQLFYGDAVGSAYAMGKKGGGHDHGKQWNKGNDPVVNPGGNGGNGGKHGVPDAGTIASLVGIGMAGVGMYSLFRNRKRG
jgi:hypothetical protein